jgi:hypothetical protein
MIREPITPDGLRFVCRNLRDFSRRELAAFGWTGSDDELAEVLIGRQGPFSWVCSLDKPVYVGGAFPLQNGVWQMWGLSTDQFRQIAKSLTKFIRRDMLQRLAKVGFQRIECRGLFDAEVVRWMALLGAKSEAVLKGCGKNGEDLVPYYWSPADVLR